MANKSPRDRLQHLFRKREHGVKKDDGHMETPAATATSHQILTSPASRNDRAVEHRQALNSTSPTSLRTANISRGRGLSESKAGQQRGQVVTSLSPEAQAAAVAAAAKAAESNQQIPSVPYQGDLTGDFSHLFITDDTGTKAQIPDKNIPDHNAERYLPHMQLRTRQPLTDRPPVSTTSTNVKPLFETRDPYSEDVADWNMVQNNWPLNNLPDAPAPLHFVNRVEPSSSANDHRSAEPAGVSSAAQKLSQKPDGQTTRPGHGENLSNAKTTRHGRPNVHDPPGFDKPLPRAPSTKLGPEKEVKQAGEQGYQTEGKLNGKQDFLIKDAKQPISLHNVVDLSNTEDTTVHEHWAPAVTHETVRHDVHEIREERITREIHQDHFFHRILPVVDVEVLPARHFVPVDGGYAEIAEDEVPGRAGQHARWVIAETVSKMMPTNGAPLKPIQFTARKFEGGDGDYKESIAPEGHTRTETHWVHPPTLETGGMQSGQTYPFYFNSPDPKDDGLRANLPLGPVVGVSPLLAKQQREQIEVQAPTAVSSERPPPVPPHMVSPAEMVARAR